MDKGKKQDKAIPLKYKFNYSFVKKQPHFLLAFSLKQPPVFIGISIKQPCDLLTYYSYCL